MLTTDVVRARISKTLRMPTMPKGASWKTSMVARVSMMPNSNSN